MNRSEIAIVIIMRIMGVSALLAIFAVFMPYSWMNACHEFMGLGTLPREPIVSYLARSLSAFYAVHGAMALLISTDIRRYRPLVVWWGAAFAMMGALLIWIDITSGMPIGWTLGEGPPSVAVGLTVLALQRRIRDRHARSPAER